MVVTVVRTVVVVRATGRANAFPPWHPAARGATALGVTFVAGTTFRAGGGVACEGADMASMRTKV